MKIIRPDFTNHRKHCIKKIQRMYAQSVDNMRALKPTQLWHKHSKKAWCNLIAHQSQNVGRTLFKGVQEKTEAKNTDIATSLQQCFDDNLHYDAREHAAKYPYMHDKYDMYAMRKMAKTVISKRKMPALHTLKFMSSDILRLISYVDTSKLNKEQQSDLEDIKTSAQNNAFGKICAHNIIDEVVHTLKTLPIHAHMREAAQYDYDTQTKIELIRAKYTSALTKATEIASYDNKQKRHSSELEILQQEIITVVSNLHTPENFNKYIDLCATPAFRYSVLQNPELAMVMQYAFQQAKKNHPEQMQATLQAFRDKYYITQDAQNIILNAKTNKKDASATARIDTYSKFLHGMKPQQAWNNDNIDNKNTNNNETCIEEWLQQGSLDFEKQRDRKNGKRAFSKGFSMAALFACFAISTLRMSIIRALMIVPPIVFAFKFGFSGLMMKHKGKFAENIHKYWQEHPEYGKNGANLSKRKRQFKHVSIIAKSLVQPVTSGLIISGISFGLRAIVIVALGNKVGAILFSSLAVFSLGSITPLAYLSEKQKRRQHDIEKLAYAIQYS